MLYMSLGRLFQNWELGKSIPDEASLSLLYQCLEIDNEEKKILKKLAINKQNAFLLIIAIVFFSGGNRDSLLFI